MSNKLTIEEYTKKNIKLINLYNDGYSQRQMSQELNISRGNLQDKIRLGKKLDILKQKLPIQSLTKENIQKTDEKQLQQQILKEKLRTEIIVDSLKEVLKP